MLKKYLILKIAAVPRPTAAAAVQARQRGEVLYGQSAAAAASY